MTLHSLTKADGDNDLDQRAGGLIVKRFLGGLVTGGAAALVTWGLTESAQWTIVAGVFFASLVWTGVLQNLGDVLAEVFF